MAQLLTRGGAARVYVGMVWSQANTEIHSKLKGDASAQKSLLLLSTCRMTSNFFPWCTFYKLEELPGRQTRGCLKHTSPAFLCWPAPQMLCLSAHLCWLQSGRRLRMSFSLWASWHGRTVSASPSTPPTLSSEIPDFSLGWLWAKVACIPVACVAARGACLHDQW